MTYQTLRCPHCKNVVDRASGYPSYIGNPFRQCPWCGKFYVHSFTREWITKSPLGRIMFLIGKPLAGAFLSMILIGGIFAMANVGMLATFILTPLFGAAVCLGWTLLRKSDVDKMAEDSLERTKSASYVQLLKKAGFKIYHIKGAQIGTQQEEEYPDQEEKTKKADKTTFDLH